VLNTANLGSI